MEWMLLPYRKLYRLIEGRASRREYWMFVLFNVLVVMGFLALIFGVVGAAALSDLRDFSGMMAGAGIVAVILLIIPFYVWALFTVVAGVAVTLRRFHDLNLTAWIYVPFAIVGMIPILNILSSIGLIVMMCMKGTSGPNRYGADPLENTSADVFS